jgi:hypothetical protein
MHVITIVTLVFLPATFVAVRWLARQWWQHHHQLADPDNRRLTAPAAQTFLQSGVFLWNNDVPDGMTETYRYRAESLNLFAWVTAPITALALGAWFAVFLHMRRRFAGPSAADLAGGNVDGGKGTMV